MDRGESVYAPLRSALSERPPDVQRPCPKTQGLSNSTGSTSQVQKNMPQSYALRHIFMDLRGVEPLSENPSITASPITVCYCCDLMSHVPSVHRKQTRFELQ